MKEIENIETERTILRKLTKEDATNFYSLNLDEDVLKYTGDKPFENLQTATDFITNYDQYEKYGVGRLAIIDKKTLEFLGWCGLKFSEDKNEYDIGFRFYKKHWNKGYATESAIACLNYGFEKLNLKRIIGRAMKENVASIKVLEKIGLKYEKDIEFEGKEAVLYNIKK